MTIEHSGLNPDDRLTPRISEIERRLPLVVFFAHVGISGRDLNGRAFSAEQQTDMIGGNLSMARQMLAEAQRVSLPLDGELVAEVSYLSQVFGPIADRYDELAKSSSSVTT